MVLSFEALISSNMALKWCIKNAVIGSNSQKDKAVERNIVPRLLEFMVDEQKPIELRTESAIVLGSLAKGSDAILQSLSDAGVCLILINGLRHPGLKYVEACLRCLRTILCRLPLHACAIFQDSSIVPLLVTIMPRSSCTQECVATIFATCCATREHQTVLSQCGAVTVLANLLSTDIYRVKMPVLRALTVLCYRNSDISQSLVTHHTGGVLLVDVLAGLLGRQQTSEMQMSVAKCLAYMCRVGVVNPADPVISRKTLSTLVRMCKPDKTWEERVDGAETLGYLTEIDVQLQRTASISDHIISTLAEYFKYPGSPPDQALMPTKKDDIVVGNELRQAAFRAYASLCANDEEVRKKVIDTKNVLEHIVNGLSDPVTKVQISAVRCLHSLSRSVQQLRTSLRDHDVSKPLILAFLNSTDESVLSVVTAIICNLLLDFSPAKKNILSNPGVVDKLLALTRSENPVLRLNGIWALMNMTFQSDASIKSQIVSRLENDDLFRLLSDPDVQIVMKTLGLLRNLISDKSSIDQTLLTHGTQMMQAVVLILEGDHGVHVKEQALCILTNMADGSTSKNCIMTNEDVLRKILHYLVQSSVVLQIAAVMCIYNLVRKEDEGYIERQNRLKDMGLQSTLQKLHSTSNTELLDRVKMTYQQF